jgi:hypothetical protein
MEEQQITMQENLELGNLEIRGLEEYNYNLLF